MTAKAEKISHGIKLDDASRPADELRALPLVQIHASTFNPRKHFDQAALDELMDSIRTHGVIEPLIVRPDAESGGYEIIGGERRYRVATAAGLDVVPCLIRAADDREALELALVENLQRRDINVIEEAEGYRALAALGYKQKDIAAKVNRSQPAVANAMRLLDLPQSILDRLASGELSTSHAIALCRFKASPPVQEYLADRTVKYSWKSRDLEGAMPSYYELTQKGLIKSLNDAAFDPMKHCKNCPFDALINNYCLRPDHFKELQLAADKEREIANQKLAEESRAKAQEALNQATQLAKVAPTKVAKQAAAKTVDSAQKAVDALISGLPQLTKMSYNPYERISGQCPTNCTEHCPCRGKAVDRGGVIIDVCLNPIRIRKLRAQDTKRDNKERKVRVAKRLDEALKAVKSVQDHQKYAPLVAIVAQAALHQTHAAGQRKAAEQAGVEFPVNSYNMMEKIQALAAYPIFQQIDFLLHAILHKEAEGAGEYSGQMLLADYVCSLLPSRTPTPPEDVAAPELPDQPQADAEAAPTQPDGSEIPLCKYCGVKPAETEAWLCMDCDPAFVPSVEATKE